MCACVRARVYASHYVPQPTLLVKPLEVTSVGKACVEDLRSR